MDDKKEDGYGRPSSDAEVGRRIEAAIRLFPTKREAADTLGISTDQLARYIKGQVSPPLSVLMRLSAVKGVSLDWLASGSGSMLYSAPVATVEPARKKGDGGVPIYDVSLSLGRGCFNGDSHPIGQLDLPPDYLREVLHCDPASAVAVYMRGSSMSPTLADRDLAIIDTSVTTLERDDIYAFSVEEDGYIKRLQKTGSSVTVHSDNSAYSDWTISGDQLETLHLIGRVVGTIRRL